MSRKTRQQYDADFAAGLETRARAAQLLRFQTALTDLTAAAIDVLGSDVVAGEVLAAAAAIAVVHGPADSDHERRALFVRAALARIEAACSERAEVHS